MNKPFLTIDEQITLLESRGVRTDNDTYAALLRDGYYSIVNGYKAAFLDMEATHRAGHDVFRAGTSFYDIYELFLFDRALRELTFHYLMKVESECKTVASHTFSEAHPEAFGYLDQSNFATKTEYELNGFGDYFYALTSLQSILVRIAERSRKNPIAHYRKSYGYVPLWVLTNDMTFGNMQHFFNLMKRAEQLVFCKRVIGLNEHAGNPELGHLEIDDAIRSINTLVKARNICAHDERFYCARMGGRRNDDYAEMLQRMRRFLTDAQFAELSASVLKLVEASFQRTETIPYVLDKMGLARTGNSLRPITAR